MFRGSDILKFFISHTTMLPDPPGVTGCAGGGAFGRLASAKYPIQHTNTSFSRGAAAFWVPSLIFDAVVFAMTISKSISTLKSNRSLGVLGILLRDGSFYFTLVLLYANQSWLTRILVSLY
jgi:hypothetical protein